MSSIAPRIIVEKTLASLRESREPASDADNASVQTKADAVLTQFFATAWPSKRGQDS